MLLFARRSVGGRARCALQGAHA